MNKIARRQMLPIVLTVVIFFCLSALLWVEIYILNQFTATDINLHIRLGDVLIGLTIYLKTSIDFAIYIGRLMDKNPGTRGRVAIELGTAIGNAAGTMIILLLWAFFKEIIWLLALMIFVASLVLLRMAEDGLEHVDPSERRYPKWFYATAKYFRHYLERLNAIFEPLLRYVIPSINVKTRESLRFWPLFGLAFTVPFVLGLDDFAGYVPLFNIINVFGFAVGVFLGHMVLNMLLYISPKHTISVVKNSIISFLGSIAFVGLAVWGIIETIKLLFFHHG